MPSMYKPEITFNLEDECYEAKIGGWITVKFYSHHTVLVEGSLLTLTISYDQITDVRGIMFRDPDASKEV